METIKPPTPLERITGSTVTEAAMTFIGALSGGPLAALLPVLSNSLASTRQRGRIEEALAEINRMLTEHQFAVNNLTDAQYKLLNEAILVVLHTTDEEKLSYLRRVVCNSLDHQDIVPLEAAVLSRIVRDISAAEADFVVRNFHFERIWLNTTVNDDGNHKVFTVDPSSPDAVIVTGLVSLGLLLSASSTYAGLGMLSWSPITAKLLSVLREPAPQQAQVR
jgi:hypothetical protein